MITLIRWLILQSKKIKWELAFWSYMDKELMTLAKHPEKIEKKIFPYIADIVHNAAKIKRDETTVQTEK